MICDINDDGDGDDDDDDNDNGVVVVVVVFFFLYLSVLLACCFYASKLCYFIHVNESSDDDSIGISSAAATWLQRCNRT